MNTYKKLTELGDRASLKKIGSEIVVYTQLLIHIFLYCDSPDQCRSILALYDQLELLSEPKILRFILGKGKSLDEIKTVLSWVEVFNGEKDVRIFNKVLNTATCFSEAREIFRWPEFKDYPIDRHTMKAVLINTENLEECREALSWEGFDILNNQEFLQIAYSYCVSRAETAFKAIDILSWKCFLGFKPSNTVLEKILGKAKSIREYNYIAKEFGIKPTGYDFFNLMLKIGDDKSAQSFLDKNIVRDLSYSTLVLKFKFTFQRDIPGLKDEIIQVIQSTSKSEKKYLGNNPLVYMLEILNPGFQSAIGLKLNPRKLEEIRVNNFMVADTEIPEYQKRDGFQTNSFWELGGVPISKQDQQAASLGNEVWGGPKK